jgi:uncharacterized repeat protein (TIGR01451 family)
MPVTGLGSFALRLLCTTGLLALATSGLASPLTTGERSRLATGEPFLVVVEFDATTVERSGQAERSRRHLLVDDSAILGLRSQGYSAIKRGVEVAAEAGDARRVRDYEHFPLSLWRLSSVQALKRLQALPAVRMVHRNVALRPVSVSDLPFIHQPQTAAEGATGAGTTVAVIDGGLANNYLSFSDFGTCTGIDTPPATCRVVYNRDYYPGASAETVHGTNVSAIALGVAPGSSLAMFDVFNGASATAADIIDALNSIVSLRTTYNIVAVNMSLGDGSTHPTQCSGSVFESAISAARSAGILSIVAAGNNGSKSGLGDPACAPDAVSVGAVYDGSYGSVSWQLPSGPCTDASQADKVTCFSQSASYLALLGPGTFVNAPNGSFQQSGTSQATPHVSGAVAVLRARYPAEGLGQTLQRLQTTGVQDTDVNHLAVPRLDLLAATNEGSAIALTGSGPTTAVSGGTATYTLMVTNSGPLAATNVRVTDTLPAGATFDSASTGCTFSAGVVTCLIGDLGVGGSVTLTIHVIWSASGPVYDTATVTADQNDISPQQTVAFGDAPAGSGTDAPLPVWAYVLLGIGLLALVTRRMRSGERLARPA